MFENYLSMNDEEKAAVKAVHAKIREALRSSPDRYDNLLWAFVRGLYYRRVERKTRTQVMADGSVVVHNRPSAAYLTARLARLFPEFARGQSLTYEWSVKAHSDVSAWLANEEGAIAAPPPREKRPYVREAAQ